MGVRTGAAPSGFEGLVDGLTSAGLRGVEAGLRAGGGTALLNFDGDADKPALVVKTHGSGKVVYLNLGVAKYGFSPPGNDEDKTSRRPRKDWSSEQVHAGLQVKAAASALYTDERQNPGSASARNLRKLTLNLLSLGGVKPPVYVTQGHGSSSSDEVFNYEKSVHELDGGGMVIGCVINSFQDGVDNDWGARNDTGEVCFGQPGATTAPATLHLGQAAHLYDTRNGKYLGGPKNTFDVDLPVYEGAVFTVLPRRVTGVTVAVEGKRLTNRVALRVSVAVEGGAAGTHVLVLEVVGADGTTKDSVLTQKIVAKQGTWTGVLPFGHGEDLDGLSVSARDVASGAVGKVALL
jgi:hypothetical protein